MSDKDVRETGAVKKFIRACCDVFDDSGKVYINLEMPGVSKENLSVKVEGDRLIIHGARKSSEGNDGKYIVREIREGDYHHEFTLDDTIDRNKIEASLKNGIALITLGVKESEKPRKISIDVK